MPDGPRESYRSTVRLEPVRLDEEGFTTINPSWVDSRKLGALTRALDRLMAAGLTEHKAKTAIDTAVRRWLTKDAGEADVERLLTWR